MRVSVIVICMACLLPLASAQNSAPPRIHTADAKNYVGKKATVCGKVVDADIRKNALHGFGFPVSFFLDQPGPDAVFYFVAFGQLDKQQEVVDAYKGRQVCVTGKINRMPSDGLPFIMASERAQIQVDSVGK